LVLDNTTLVRPNKLISEKGDTFTTYKLAKPARLTPQGK